jgi:hypothetical protein
MKALSISFAALALALLGCGSLNPYPRDQEYRVLLQVADQNGNPVEGAAIWIDQDLMLEHSQAQFSTVGSGYPHEWQGWQYNFASPKLSITIDYSGDTDEVEIIVSKVGFRTERFSWTVGEDPDTAFFRRVCILEPLYPAASP